MYYVVICMFLCRYVTSERAANLSSSASMSSSRGGERTIKIDRRVYTSQLLIEAEKLRKAERVPLKAMIKEKVASKLKCSKNCLGEQFLKRLPIINVLRNYKKSFIAGDIVAGLTVGVVHILLGMGIAQLSNVPPIYGVYTSFFHVLVYFFFGTSNQLSTGVMPLISIMIGAVVEREYDPSLYVAPSIGQYGNYSNITATTSSTPSLETEIAIKVGLATSVSLLCGLIQLAMSFLHLDFITLYMSQPFVGGFTTGAAVHIITSQMKVMLGMHIKAFTGPFKLIYIWIDIFSNISKVNVATLIISIISLVSLVFTRSCINIRFKSKLPIPIPIELIVIIIGTLVSYFCALEGNYGVKTVGPLPLGIPAPVLPPMWNLTNYITDAVIMAIVGYAIAISTAKLFTKKYRYDIDSNQELLALGLCNTMSAFFTGFAGCGAPPRTMLFDSSGGKTQVSSIYMLIVLLLDIMVVGYLLKSLPVSILGTVITFAVLPMFANVFYFKRLWPISKIDFFIWLTTFLAVLILDIDYGLAVGIVFSILTVLAKTQLPKASVLGRVNQTNIYQPVEAFHNLNPVPGLVVFRFDAPVFFGNAEILKRELYSKVLNPNRHTSVKITEATTDDFPLPQHNSSDPSHTETRDDTDRIENGNHNNLNLHDTASPNTSTESHSNQRPIHAIVLDCSALSYVDSVGANVLQQIFEDYEAVDITLALANCNEGVLDVLDRSGYITRAKLDTVFVSVHDAVVALQLTWDENTQQFSSGRSDADSSSTKL